MKINCSCYTSYYAKVSRRKFSNTLLIQVSNTIPNWIQSSVVEVTDTWYPEWSLINKYKEGIISVQDFRSHYLDYLESHVDKEKILSEINELINQYNITEVILLCWEKDYETCHRSILAQWLFGDDYAGEYI